MKVLVVFTGGTIGSTVGENGLFSPNNSSGYKLLELYNQLTVKYESVT